MISVPKMLFLAKKKNVSVGSFVVVPDKYGLVVILVVLRSHDDCDEGKGGIAVANL